jgi:hypothetical protein
LLASFGASSPGYTTLDLSDLSGHDIRVSLTAEIAMAGAEGFGGGADALGARSFSSALSGGFQLSHVAIPEPASALLIAVGLSSIALSRRRR